MGEFVCGKAVVRGRYTMSAIFSYDSPCNERSLRPKNAFHCEIFTQKFVRMVFVSYLCTASGKVSGGKPAEDRKRVYTCTDML